MRKIVYNANGGGRFLMDRNSTLYKP